MENTDQLIESSSNHLSLRDLAERLSTSALSSVAISDGLRVLGYRASTVGLRQVLVASNTLKSHFHHLEGIFPGAQKILTDFQRSEEILKLLDSESLGGGSIQHSYISTPFCRAIGDQYFSRLELNEFPAMGELIAFFWTVHTCIHAHPNIVVSDNLAELLKKSIDFVYYALEAVEDYPDEIRQHQVTLGDGISEWIDSAAPIFSMISRSSYKPQSLHNAFCEAVELVRALNFAPPINISSHVDSHESSLITAQRGVSLSERERLNVHHNAFHDAELRDLTKAIRQIIENGLLNQSMSHRQISSAPQFFFESVIAAIAIATGRTIRGAIQLALEPGSTEYLKLDLHIGYNSTFYYPIWIRSISSKNIISIPLPAFLQCLTQEPLRFKLASCVEDCLPYSLIPWEDRCVEWLKKFLPTTAHKINRRLRDALPREIYKLSANEALLEWITTPTDTHIRKSVSLSSYLNPYNELTIKFYGDACTGLFNKYSAPKKIRESFTKDVGLIGIREQRHVSELFLRNLELAEKTGDVIEYHNALARYVLMLLIVATGHRKSKTPFFFPWDILPDVALAFISDKQTVGSEARFLPLPSWLVKLVVDYKNHLYRLAKKLEVTNSKLSEDILQLVTVTKNERRGNSAFLNSTSISQFFTIDKNSKPVTLSTRDLENSYSSATDKGIRVFRKSAADYLWSQGLSGHQISTFLGHNGELHALGESSAWSVLEWAEQIRGPQEAYLNERGWKPVSIKIGNDEKKAFVIPHHKKSNDSYEGRSISNAAARSVARKLIREFLPAEWFQSDDARITEEDVVNLKKAVTERLSFDPDICSKVNYAIAKEIEPIRNLVGKHISSTLTNLTRTEAGPISTTSSRHYAISTAIRQWWIGQLGNFAKDPQQNLIDRLAAIGISLILFDATLNKAIWMQVISAIAHHDTCAASGCLIIRAKVKISAKVFDKSIPLSPYTVAQIVGFHREHHAITPDNSVAEIIIKRIARWLKSAEGLGDVASLDQLIAVFSAWWLPRLAGAEYAIATGEYTGPAPDVLSECALYGIQATETPEVTSYLNLKNTFSRSESSPKHARAMINNLLDEAEGEFERKQQTSRFQRIRLANLLSQEHSHTELKQYAEQNPIVQIMLGFILYMLDEGGMRVATYRFSSIRTNYSNSANIIDELWDRNVEELESNDFDEVYKRVLSASNRRGFAIWYFHKYLMETYGVPTSSIAMRHKRPDVQCRSSLITTKQFETSWQVIASQKDDGQLIHHLKTYLSLCYQYGLRAKEAIGASTNHLLSPEPLRLLVEKNSSRDLKTKNSSLRIVGPFLVDKPYQKHLSGVLALCQHAPDKDISIFSNAEKRDEIYSKSRISQAATLSLRESTGNMSVVPHSMRHTAATRLARTALRSPRRIPLSSSVDDALDASLKNELITSYFKQGFHAWPFWPDRVSMLLGHASVDSLFNTYCHISHINLAERTWFFTEDIKVTDQQLASMLVRDRSVITKMKSRFSFGIDNDSGMRSALERLIAHYVDKSHIPEIGYEYRDSQKSKTIPATHPEIITAHLWISFDRLMCARLNDGLSFDDTRRLSASFNLSKNETSGFFDAYQRIVQQTGFDDFEPTNSELLSGTSKRNAGTRRGAMERERGVSSAQRLVNESPEFAGMLRHFSNMWINRVNSKDPWFVATDADELTLLIDVLTALGVVRAQLEIAQYNFNVSRLRPSLKQSEIDSIATRNKRFSLGPTNVRVSEIGVRVMQRQDGKIGDHRDTHRLALILAALSKGND